MDREQLTPRQKRLRQRALQQLEGFLNKQLADHLGQRIRIYDGNFDILESAIGALIVGQTVGWRVLILIHSSRTVKRYQDVLGLDFKGKLPWNEDIDVMPEVGPFATKSNAYLIAQKIDDFWKVVRGQTDEIASASDRKNALPLGE